MADTNCIRRDCVACDSPLNGLQKLYCADVVTQTCAQCAKSFTGRKRKYCTSACNYKAQARKRGVRPMEEYRASVRKDAHYFWCVQCHKSAHRPLGGNGTRNRFCSMACRVDCSRAKQSEIDALYRIARNNKPVKPTKPPKPLDVLVCCRNCSSSFVAPRTKGNHRRSCDSCLIAAKASHKVRRKARMDGAYAENVNPFRVFDRDKWRCQLCGIRTPKALRGTYNDVAPELDHIIPLSLGGPHSYINTQCACRRCNGRKRARPMGQMLLVG